MSSKKLVSVASPPSKKSLERGSINVARYPAANAAAKKQIVMASTTATATHSFQL